jgi:Chaperone of endosialidase
MKQIFIFLMTATLFVSQSAAQSVAINTDGSAATASSILDIKSTAKGLLIPRMTTAQRTAIATPAKSLMVFDTDSNSFWYFDGIGWNTLSSGSSSNYWTASGANIFKNNSGNVGIGLNSPLAPLHLKNDNEALRIQGTTPYISFYDNAGTNKSFLQNFNDNLYMGTPSSNLTGNMQFYLKNIPVMTILPSGNVGIGTEVPDEKLTVQTLNNSYGIFHRGEGGNILGTKMGGTSAGIGTFSNTNMRIFANGNSAMFINSGNSYVGLGGDFPVNKFQIGTITNPGPNYTGNDLAISDGINAMRIYQSPNTTVIASDNTNMVLWPKEATGNVGINTLQQPTNKLQIGSVGGTGFATNDLAIGNGTNAMAIYQTNTSTLIGSTTDIILKPRNNGAGRVGINTNTPRAPLDVASSSSPNNPNPLTYYAYMNVDAGTYGIGSVAPAYVVPNISIMSDGRVLATEFDAYSDARIKNVTGISNASKDLETVNGLHVTDYTMKDKVKYGNQAFKKVIAQEVEKIYPQVVSKHTDFIPNVYQACSKPTKSNNGYLLSFNAPHNISKGAKKLQVLLEGGGSMQQVNIIAIPSANEVIIDAADIKGDKVFVYGEEVDDFRTVDYEGLTTLNISASQELTKLLKQQQVMIELLQKKVADLEAKDKTWVQK